MTPYWFPSLHESSPCGGDKEDETTVCRPPRAQRCVDSRDFSHEQNLHSTILFSDCVTWRHEHPRARFPSPPGKRYTSFSCQWADVDAKMKAICSPTPARCTYRDDPNVVCCWTMTSPQLHIHLQFPLTRCRSSLLLSQHAAGCLCHWAHSWYHSPSARVCVCVFLFISVSALVSWLCVCECVTDTLAPRCLLLQHSCRSVREHSCPIWSSSTEFLVCCWFCRHNTIVVLWRPEFNTEEDAFNWQPIVLFLFVVIWQQRDKKHENIV